MQRFTTATYPKGMMSSATPRVLLASLWWCLVSIGLVAGAAHGQGYICAEGGGNANKGAWADEVFGWMVEKSQRGPAVIIGAVPLDKDERVELLTRLGSRSVTCLVIERANADDPDTAAKISSASLVFIRGGDQSRYVNWWKNTATSRALRAVFDHGGVIAGTSAGCAVLGELVYDAANGSLSAKDALTNARHPDLTLTHDFLSYVPGVLFDTHFAERARLPRLAVMLAVAKADLGREFIGIGVDPRTAVCISPDGKAEIRGEGHVTIMMWSPSTTASVIASSPPQISGMNITYLGAGCRFVPATGAVIESPVPAAATPAQKPDGTALPPQDLWNVFADAAGKAAVPDFASFFHGPPWATTVTWHPNSLTEPATSAAVRLRRPDGPVGTGCGSDRAVLDLLWTSPVVPPPPPTPPSDQAPSKPPSR